MLNQLLGHDRAIVSPIPGTTRDTIEETANIRGVPVVFIDTAGLREAGDEIELEGIRRSRESLGRAEFILHVLDASEPLADENYLAEFAGKKRILVCNKMDLPRKLVVDFVGSSTLRRSGDGKPPEGGTPNGCVVDVCCVSGQGIEVLKDAIKSLVWSGEIKSEMLQVMINSRHQDALRRARESSALTLDLARQSFARPRCGGSARRCQRRGRSCGSDCDGGFAGFHLQPVLHRQMTVAAAKGDLLMRRGDAPAKVSFTSASRRRKKRENDNIAQPVNPPRPEKPARLDHAFAQDPTHEDGSHPARHAAGVPK